MIDFTRAFESAWERMHVILFRPFDFGKWCAIGLSAFLAGMIQGGNGLNSSFNSNNFQDLSHPGHAHVTTNNASLHQVISNMLASFSTVQVGVAVAIVVGVFVLVLGLVLLFGWLGARGQFMFIDNVVRNRGAVGWPWQAYARQANSFFLVHLVLVLISFLIIIPLLAIAVVMCIPLYRQDRWPNANEIIGFVVVGVAYLVASIGITIVMFLFREFGAPIMFRKGLLARAAFFEALGLVTRFPGSIAVFLLLRIALFIGVAVISLIICCATCCIGTLPYIGTVLLLPVLVYLKCFTLDCLAQFGPEYDVWTVDVPVDPGYGATLPFNPQPPPG